MPYYIYDIPRNNIAMLATLIKFNMHVYKWTVRTEYIITRINVLGKDVAVKARKNTYLITTASLIII